MSVLSVEDITTNSPHIDKSKWPDGPWKSEPDLDVFIDEDTKYPCVVKRIHEIGHMCGYVVIFKDHPAYGLEYDDIHDEFEIYVHGGLTFSDNKVNFFDIPDKKYWVVGFDCAHCDDFMPGVPMYIPSDFYNEEIYKTIDYVKNEVKSLAKQLKEIEVNKK